jgi:hypothetical protein
VCGSSPGAGSERMYCFSGAQTPADVLLPLLLPMQLFRRNSLTIKHSDGEGFEPSVLDRAGKLPGSPFPDTLWPDTLARLTFSAEKANRGNPPCPEAPQDALKHSLQQTSVKEPPPTPGSQAWHKAANRRTGRSPGGMARTAVSILGLLLTGKSPKFMRRYGEHAAELYAEWRIYFVYVWSISQP